MVLGRGHDNQEEGVVAFPCLPRREESLEGPGERTLGKVPKPQADLYLRHTPGRRAWQAASGQVGA